MIKGKLMAALLVASLAASAASYVGGRVHQSNIQHTRDLEAQVEGFERATELEAQLVEKEAELVEQARQLEEIARATPPATTGSCFPADRVRRLNQLR